MSGETKRKRCCFCLRWRGRDKVTEGVGGSWYCLDAKDCARNQPVTP